MKRPIIALGRLALIALIVAAIVAIFRAPLHTNPATVGFAFLLAVLIISAMWGLRYAIVLALLSSLAYNYFFLPPVHTLRIADVNNWSALVGFLITAVIGSQLSERARNEARKSDLRRRELERLYVFSQQLLSSDNVPALAKCVPAQIVEVFGGSAAALFIAVPPLGAHYSDAAARRLVTTDELESMAHRTHQTVSTERATTFVPLRLGEHSLGVLAFAGTNLSNESMEAIASLLAIAIERTGAVEQLARTEAERESERLRSVLLDSVTHDFRTPLTAIKASAQTLQGGAALDEPARQDLLAVIAEESDRLDRLVGEAAELAQLDSKGAKLDLAHHDIGEAVDLALASAKHALACHKVKLSLNEQLPAVNFDLRRIQEVLAQFLDNAAKYSPPGSTITISAEAQGKMLVTRVADEGPGIALSEQRFVFDKFFRGSMRGRSVRGTGMGLAIAKAIAEAHGGTIGVDSEPGRGATFHFALPLE